MTQGLNIDRLKRVMTESYPDKVLKDLDGRSATKAPWQKSPNNMKRKPFHKKKTGHAKMAEGLDEDEYEEEEDDVNALDDDDYNEYDWYGDYSEEEDDEEFDEDQVAYVDEEGWFYADEETINVVDEMLTQDDDEFAAILTTYTEARGALAKARIARGLYPVVVPADSGPPAHFGRQGGKRRPKGKGKEHKPKGPPRPKARARPSAKPPAPLRPQRARLDRPAGSGKGNRAAPICFRCGKVGHLSAYCTNAPKCQKVEAN